jgi:hypothetical protein
MEAYPETNIYRYLTLQLWIKKLKFLLPCKIALFWSSKICFWIAIRIEDQWKWFRNTDIKWWRGMTGLSQPAVCCGAWAGDLYAGGTQQSTGQTFLLNLTKASCTTIGRSNLGDLDRFHYPPKPKLVFFPDPDSTLLRFFRITLFFCVIQQLYWWSSYLRLFPKKVRYFQWKYLRKFLPLFLTLCFPHDLVGNSLLTFEPAGSTWSCGD